MFVYLFILSFSNYEENNYNIIILKAASFMQTLRQNMGWQSVEFSTVYRLLSATRWLQSVAINHFQLII